MARVQSNSSDFHTVKQVVLNRFYFKSRINFSNRIVGKTRNHLNLKTLLDQLFSEVEALERRFRLKPLRQQQHADFGYGLQYFFQTTRFT